MGKLEKAGEAPRRRFQGRAGLWGPLFGALGGAENKARGFGAGEEMGVM